MSLSLTISSMTGGMMNRHAKKKAVSSSVNVMMMLAIRERMRHLYWKKQIMGYSK